MTKYSIPIKVKNYFDSGRRKIVSISPNDDYTITVNFDNNEIKCYDMRNQLRGIFSELKDLTKFKQAFIDDDGNIAWDRDSSVDSSLIWNNRIDICSDAVYIDSK